MKKGNISIGIAIAIAMAVVLAVSGCVDNIGEKEYGVCPLVKDTEPIGDTKYFLELKEVRTFAPSFGSDEAVIAIYYGDYAIKDKIEQRRILVDNSIEIGKLVIALDYVDKEGKYAAFTVKISSTEIDIAPVLEAGATIKKVAEGVVESASSS